MAGRVDEARFAGAGSFPGERTGRRLASGQQRFIFAFALFLFGIATFYSAVALLTRVTPALFPGQTFGDIIPFKGQLIDPLPIPEVIKPSEPGTSSSFNQRINLLVIGVDKRPGSTDEAAYNTDTIMIATIDPVSKVISVLSFPRDMWIDIHRPGNVVYKNRINASYATGFQADGGTFEAGANQLIKDIKADFAIDINYWLLMDFTGVEKLIDSVGGVTLNIPYELSVPDWYYTDDDRTDPHYESFPSGTNTLNGYRAVAFGRYRNDSDFLRVKRQQLVLSAALAKVFGAGLLESNPRDLYDAYTKLLHHNVPFSRAAGLLPLVKDTHGEVNFFSMGDPVDGRQTLEGYIVPTTGASVQLYDPENARYWINQAFNKSKYARSVVELQSGRGDGPDQSALTGLSRYLRFTRSLPDVQFGPDAPVALSTSITLYSEERREMAEDIAGWLGLSKSVIHVEKRTSASQPDIVILVGRDYKAPPS